MKIYSVYGKKFTDLSDAVGYMEQMKQFFALQSLKLDFIDAAVIQSDMRESKEILNHIMKK